MFVKLFLVLLACGSCVERRERAALRVYRGETASLKEFNFIVMLAQKKQTVGRWCTASLIAETWVLTAAHCFFYTTLPRDEWIVRYGDFYVPVNETKLYSNVISTFTPTSFIVTNPDVARGVLRDDIGLLLVERIPNKPIGKLLALDYKTLFGLPAKYAGFGNILKSYFAPHVKHLQSVPLQVGEGVLLPCSNFKNVGPIICVEPKCSNREQGGRPADSGGPLVYDGRIIGVTKGPSSWTMREKVGSCFTPVSIYFEWIKQVMSLNRAVHLK